MSARRTTARAAVWLLGAAGGLGCGCAPVGHCGQAEAGSCAGRPSAGPAAGRGGLGAGGFSGSAGEGGHASGGFSGTAGGGGAEPEVDPPGGMPVWEDLPAAVMGCKLQRLSNAEELSLFALRACDDLPHCRETVWHELLVPVVTSHLNAVANDDGAETRLLVRSIVGDSEPEPTRSFFIATPEGRLRFGLRIDDAYRQHCGFGNQEQWGQRFGVILSRAEYDEQNRGKYFQGALLGSFDAPEEFLGAAIPELASGTQSAGYGVGGSNALNGVRWVHNRAPSAAVSVSALDAGDFRFLARATYEGPILDVTRVETTGLSFLIDMVEQREDGTLREYIAKTDGLAPATPFIVPEDGYGVGGPTFAHTHLVWGRGKNLRGPNVYDSAELWAAPYTENGAELRPFKLADAPAENYPGSGSVGIQAGDRHGGWGHYLDVRRTEVNFSRQLNFYRLATREHRLVTLPQARSARRVVGITRTHAWIESDNYGEEVRGKYAPRPFLMRFDLDD